MCIILLLPFVNSQICCDLLFHLLHSLINMGKEMSTLHTLIFTHWFLHFHLPITHTSTKLLILAPSIIKWIHIYPKSLFIEKFFIPFHFSSFKTSCSGSKLLVYMQRKIRSRKFLYSNNTGIRSTTSPWE